MEDFAVLILPLLLVGVIAYLLGSISFAIILTKLFVHEDVRHFGSGNAGATNVLRVAGKKASALTFLLDFLKCAASVAIGYFVLRYVCDQNGFAPTTARLGMYVAGFMCFVGHMYPLYFGFRGGKGVVTVSAMMLLLDWRVFLVCFAIFTLTFIWKKMVSLSSIVSAAAYPIVTFLLTWFLDYMPSDGTISVGYVVLATAVSGLIGAIVIFKHRANIRRILKGEEKPISFKKQ